MRGLIRYDCATAAFVLRVVEALLITTAILTSIAYMTNPDPLLRLNEFALPLGAVAVILVVMHMTGLYGLVTLFDFRALVPRIALITLLVFALAVVTTGQLAKYDIVSIYPYRWQWTFGLTAIWLLCVLAPRYALNQLIERGYLTRRILAVVDEPGGGRLKQLCNTVPGRFLIAAQVSHSDLGAANLTEIAAGAGAPEIVVSTLKPNTLSEALLSQRKLLGLPVTDYHTFYERETDRVDLNHLSDAWLAAVPILPGRAVHTYRRALDVTVALIAAVSAAPVMLLAALAIRIEDGQPVLFRQTRVGLHGKEFTLYKFRSMRVDAEQDSHPLWAAENDSRITRVGFVIRKLRIDELPQFYNVLRGDMSFIGPRPERPYFVEQLARAIPFYTDRHKVKPGITGWAQINFHYGASFEDARQKTAYDLYYVKHRSVLLDLLIAGRTVKVILWPRGVR